LQAFKYENGCLLLNSFAFSLFLDVAPFIEFLKSIQDGTIVLMATYDDGATKYVVDLYSKYCLNFCRNITSV